MQPSIIHVCMAVLVIPLAVYIITAEHVHVNHTTTPCSDLIPTCEEGKNGCSNILCVIVSLLTIQIPSDSRSWSDTLRALFLPSLL